ncbi:hypothetical protein D777_02167 [Marinobacter nitratireducens]|uniref:Ferric siderophore reductase C-terminal domain-containing protein n=1 Tax=Marinobacter nitratireducens TaxID=1137280 RepID=A0A072N017_9GAMM|nr:(2Fe-2S)-binding protein [Marinobacter nitratireducens]KEF31014.1 hypothetical protein D777_02167 [Marinobacter nitratireducens]
MAAAETQTESAPRCWPERYRQLLSASQLDANEVLGQALRAPNLERPALLSLRQCLEQPDLLKRQLLADYPEMSEPQQLRAALSVAHQDLSLSVIAPLIITLFLRGEAGVPDPGRIFLAPANEGSSVSRWFQAGQGEAVGVEPFITHLSTAMNDWYPTFRKSLGVSPGAYWSSVGLALGAPFSAVWNLAVPRDICTLAGEWLEQFWCDANRYIDWIPAEFGDQACALPQRKGCCLKYLLPGNGYCGTCGIHRKQRLSALRQSPHSQPPGQWRPQE